MTTLKGSSYSEAAVRTGIPLEETGRGRQVSGCTPMLAPSPQGGPYWKHKVAVCVGPKLLLPLPAVALPSSADGFQLAVQKASDAKLRFLLEPGWSSGTPHQSSGSQEPVHKVKE